MIHLGGLACHDFLRPTSWKKTGLHSLFFQLKHAFLKSRAPQWTWFFEQVLLVESPGCRLYCEHVRAPQCTKCFEQVLLLKALGIDCTASTFPTQAHCTSFFEQELLAESPGCRLYCEHVLYNTLHKVLWVSAFVKALWQYTILQDF
jgi:hypothetical protein